MSSVFLSSLREKDLIIEQEAAPRSGEIFYSLSVRCHHTLLFYFEISQL